MKSVERSERRVDTRSIAVVCDSRESGARLWVTSWLDAARRCSRLVEVIDPKIITPRDIRKRLDYHNIVVVDASSFDGPNREWMEWLTSPMEFSLAMRVRPGHIEDEVITLVFGADRVFYSA